jgi:Fe-S cluster assembly protein SufD
VFQGKIIVRPDAQKTDGYQLNRALLLSDTAEIDSKPELEIYADDVKCSHGATAGELDDDQLFYLRARGIDLETARNLLISAFLADAINEVRIETVRDSFQGIVSGWLKSQRA